ncbi:MAG TPA: enoyl-CoA hydratase-related protein [Candidatus Acidoferrum sp.]|nr:enoyl-CoA hydratase-related protein [Candidatus Acidoferrum sp.]
MSTPPQPVQENQNAPVLQHVEDGLAILTLNRPDRMNAINGELATALNEALTAISVDKHIHAVIITGAGKAFCAGGDLKEIWEGRQKNDKESLEPLLRSGMGAMLKMRTMRQPIVAAVNGAAAGAGMNIALAADVRFAAETASFGETFAKVGLFPDFGGTFFLPQLVGHAKAAELLYTGDMFDAKTALQLGVVNRLVPADKLLEEAKNFAMTIVTGPRVASRALKQVLFGNQRAELTKALEYEVEEQMRCFASEDSAEGLRAFFEKRKPNFQGK